MRKIGLLSNALIIAGVMIVIIAQLVSPGDAWTLAGIMLVLLGLVKIAMVFVWTRIAHLDDDRHSPVQGS